MDPKTGAFFTVAGGSFAISTDQGKTFSQVYQTSVPAGWPRQGNGTMAVSHRVLVAPFFVTTAPAAGAKCPRLAVGTSPDYGKTPLTPHLAAQADMINTSGTVRYPIAAAERARPGRFAVSTYTADHHHVVVHYTEDGGNTSKSLSPAPPAPEFAIVNANQTSVGYASDGGILVVWRGFQAGPAAPPAAAPGGAAGAAPARGTARGGGRGRAPAAAQPGPFDTFAALLEKGKFGPTIKVSQEVSTYPAIIAEGNYGQNNGGGDFATWITGNDQYAFIAFPYSPGGVTEDTYLGKVPLASMR